MKFVVLLAVALGAAPAYSAFYQWSKTASSNANADPSINWAEGQSPSSVNDSARAMMARAAEYRDDISGSLTTGGTSTAYTLTTNQGLPSTPTNGQMIAFVPHVTNGFCAQITMDGGSSFSIITTASPAACLPSGTLVAGTPYRVSFNNTAGWVLEGFYGNPFNVPLGAYLHSSIATAPNSNFVAADGSCISRSTYASYFAAVTTTYGACDGTTTFGVPDMRGRVAAMIDGGVGRMTNSANGCGVVFNSVGVSCGSESQTLTLAQTPAGITSTGGALAVTTSSTTANTATGTIQSANVTGGADKVFTNNGKNEAIASSGSTAAQSVSSTNTGGSPHPNVQPTFAVQVFVRVI